MPYGAFEKNCTIVAIFCIFFFFEKKYLLYATSARLSVRPSVRHAVCPSARPSVCVCLSVRLFVSQICLHGFD